MDLFAPNHLILIAIVVLLLFGGKKIPELMRGLGRGVREFNDAKSTVHKDLDDTTSDRERRVASKPVTSASNTTTTQP